jgi:hypothetical protein
MIGTRFEIVGEHRRQRGGWLLGHRNGTGATRGDECHSDKCHSDERGPRQYAIPLRANARLAGELAEQERKETRGSLGRKR